MCVHMTVLLSQFVKVIKCTGFYPGSGCGVSNLIRIVGGCIRAAYTTYMLELDQFSDVGMYTFCALGSAMEVVVVVI